MLASIRLVPLLLVRCVQSVPQFAQQDPRDMPNGKAGRIYRLSVSDG